MPKAKSKQSPVSGLLSSIDASAKKNKVNICKSEDFEKMYGVKYYITTGLPSFDMMLFNNTEDKGSGIPSGRVTELVGNPSSYKSYFANKICAKTVKMGGMAFYISTEADYDKDFFHSFYLREGLTAQEASENTRLMFAKKVSDVTDAMKSLMQSFKDHYDKGGEVIPAVIVLDSMAGLFSNSDFERYSKDPQKESHLGSTAKDLQNMFKFVLGDLARYNIAMVVVNQYRANIGGTFKKWKPFSDNSIRYWKHCSVEMKSRSLKGENKTSLGQSYTRNSGLTIKISKIRGDFTADGTLDLTFTKNRGFDYFESLIDAVRMSGLAKLTGNLYKFDANFEGSEEILKPLRDWAEDLQMTEPDLRAAFNDLGPDYYRKLEKFVIDAGPRDFYKDSRAFDDEAVFE